MGHHCRSALGDAAPSDHADAPAPPGPESLPGPVDGTPPRRPGSLRRTATIDMGWPGGLGTALHLVGRARDLLTPLRGDPVVLDAAEMHAEIGEHRTITAIRTTPPRPGIDGLVGARGGSSRAARSTACCPVSVRRPRHCISCSTTSPGPA